MMTAPSHSTSHAPFNDPSTGGRMVTTTGRSLPLLGTVLSAEAEGGVARVTLEQRFRNPHSEPLAVTYSLPLPADGAVSGFSFRIGGRRVVGEIDRKRAARERYEQALIEGKSAALLEQDRSSLFTQEVGNIPPGVEVIVEVSIDQRLVWTHEGAWEWRFPTVVAPRYLGEQGRVSDAARVTQDVADGPLPARFALGCVVRDRIASGRAPESPTHAIEIANAEGGTRISLRDKAGARLDRDVVVRWRVATPKVGVSLATAHPSNKPVAHGLLTVVPPSIEGRYQPVSRDLVVLLDTSGSMGGEPLSQAVRVTSAIIETLRDDDQIELIEFGSHARRWNAHPVRATASARRDAITWLRNLRASGSTEMRSAIIEALASARTGSQKQVVLITDGLIGFESQVVQAICDRLPASSRVHTVGVGSAVNRSLTGPAARAGHGVEIVIGLGEDPERAAARIVARTNAPLLVDLSLEGSALVEHAPSRLPDLFAASPALISLALRPEGGELIVRGRTLEGSWEQRMRVAPCFEGSGNMGIAALFGREKVEDLEMRLAAGGDSYEIDRAIEALGIDFQISTRLTSWVAVSEEQTVDPSDPMRRERMPHELPHGMSAEGLGLRPAMAPAAVMSAMPTSFAAPMPPPGMAPPAADMRRASPSKKIDLRARLGKSTQADDRHEEQLASAPWSAGEPPRAAAAPAPAPAKTIVIGQAEAPKGRGILGAIKDFFTGGQHQEEPAASFESRKEMASIERPKPPAESVASPEPIALLDDEADAIAPTIALRGRVMLHRAGLLVIEISADGGPIAWDPSGEIEVTLSNGVTYTAKLDAGRTTKRGAVAMGATVRLAIAIDASAPLDAPSRITITRDRGIVTIDLG